MNTYITLNNAASTTVIAAQRFAKIDGYSSTPFATDTSAFDFQGTVLPVTTAGQVVNCVSISSNYGMGSIASRAVLLQTSGIVKIEIGGLFNCGDPITTDANGKAIAATNGAYVAGYAVDTITSFKQANRQYSWVELTSLNAGTDGRGHFLANGSGITTAIGNGFGTITQTGNSSRGNISVATGAGFPSTNIINHTFTTPYAYAPTVIVTPTNALTAAQTPYVSASSTTGFTVTLASTGSSQTYAYNYMVIA
jgi:hypothetical protein